MKDIEISQLEKVKQDGYSIQYMKNPSENVKLAAVEDDGCSIQFIDFPSKEIQLVAVRETQMLFNLSLNQMKRYK